MSLRCFVLIQHINAILIGKKSEMEKKEGDFLGRFQEAEKCQEEESPNNGKFIVALRAMYIHVLNFYRHTTATQKEKKCCKGRRKEKRKNGTSGKETSAEAKKTR